MRRTKPVGHPTRGKTALNRLRQVDVYVALAHAETLRGGTPLAVDVGFGALPWTTLEMRARWLAINPRLRVLGLEIDPARVADALPYAAPPAVDFRLGGFNVRDALLPGETVRLIRCYNVMRQYEEDAVPAALAAMGEALSPGGLLIEGTSNPSGRIVTFDVYCKGATGRLDHLALVFGTNFRAPVEPGTFQTILPKRLIHRMLESGPAVFFAAWKHAFARSAHVTGVRARWMAAGAHLIAETDWPVAPQMRLLRRGFLILRDRLWAG